MKLGDVSSLMKRISVYEQDGNIQFCVQQENSLKKGRGFRPFPLRISYFQHLENGLDGSPGVSFEGDNSFPAVDSVRCALGENPQRRSG